MTSLKIFVSYTSADKDWAHWIAWTLKEAGYTPFVHEWEVPAGGNIPDWMERRVKQADHLIGVFSDRYIDPVYSKSERTAAFWKDPIGKEGFLIPVEVSRVSEWPQFVAPLKRLSLVGLDQDAAREALVVFLKPPTPPPKAPKFPGKRKVGAEEEAAFGHGGETLSSKEPLFPPQERRFIGDVAQEKGVDPDRLRPILENLGLTDIPVDQIADRLRDAVDALRGKADEPMRASNASGDLESARVRAGERLRVLDTEGALAVWDAFIAEDGFEAALRRRTAALKEKGEILRLRYDHAAAAATLREAVRIDPDDTGSHIASGDIAAILNDSMQALQAFRAAETVARQKEDDPGVATSLNRIADVLVVQGDLAGALAIYEEGLAIRRQLASADPSHGEHQRDLSVSLNKTGDVLLAQGDLAGALAIYEEGLAIRRRLASAEPSHAERQRDLSVSLNKTGDVLVAQGDLAGAFAVYEEGLVIARRLASADPSHAERQRDLSVSLERTGDVLVAQDDLAGALARYGEGLAITRRLASADASHSERQRDLSVSLNKTSRVLVAQGDLAGALAGYEEGLAIRRRLASADPSHAERQRDLSVSLNNAGDVLVAQGDLAEAAARYEEGLAIRRRLASADPSHAERQRDVCISLAKLADTAHAQGVPERSCRYLAEALEIMRSLTSRLPEHPHFRALLQRLEKRRNKWGCARTSEGERKRKERTGGRHKPKPSE
jgi:tetratricopeptide (TPR) repeat protein